MVSIARQVNRCTRTVTAGATEGFDAADVKYAKALLNELAQPGQHNFRRLWSPVVANPGRSEAGPGTTGMRL
jgi:hypothetical protein